VTSSLRWKGFESTRASFGAFDSGLSATAAKPVADVERALERDDAPALRQAVHTLKSSSANLGAARLARHCAALESLARAGRVLAARQDWPAARDEYGRVVRALEAMAHGERALQ